jgi:hypothetical protein
VTVTVNVQKLIDYLSFSFTIVSVKCQNKGKNSKLTKFS